MYHQAGEMAGQKRGRDVEDELDPQNVQEHRQKRRIASLPLRRSPDSRRRFASSVNTIHLPPRSPTFADITPSASDSEDPTLPPSNEPRSFFSPWSSPLDVSLLQSSQDQDRSSPSQTDSQSSHTHSTTAYSDDLEMADDSGLAYPGPFHAEGLGSSAGRVSTPITANFASHVRSLHKAPPPSYVGHNITSSPQNYTYDSSLPRRLPSPISEDELSPGSLVDVQMDEDISSATNDMNLEDFNKAPSKKGHQRSKHSLRTWGGSGSDVGGVKKEFSMGYRSDCEKCRMRVPGHFSHVVAY